MEIINTIQDSFTEYLVKPISSFTSLEEAIVTNILIAVIALFILSQIISLFSGRDHPNLSGKKPLN
jgi:hypothetical protein